MFNPKIVDNFLSEEDCNFLIKTVNSIDIWEDGGNEFWNNRCLNAINIYNNISKDAGKLLYNIRNNIKESIKKEYDLNTEVYPDLTQIVRWFPGMEQNPHSDDMADIEGRTWFNHRNFGAIIYLNNNYSGGQTYYPDHNFFVEPKVGRLALHPGDKDNFHGVTKVNDNIRYTIASFWTFDKGYYDGWTIP